MLAKSSTYPVGAGSCSACAMIRALTSCRGNTALLAEHEREAVRAAALFGRREAPSQDLMSDAGLGFRCPSAGPRAVRDVDARDVAGAGDRHGHVDRAGQRRIHLEAVLRVAELELRLAAADVVAKVRHVASRSSHLFGANHARRCDADRREADAPAAADADQATAAGRGAQAFAKPAASGRARALAALAVADDRLAALARR